MMVVCFIERIAMGTEYAVPQGWRKGCGLSVIRGNHFRSSMVCMHIAEVVDDAGSGGGWTSASGFAGLEFWR